MQRILACIQGLSDVNSENSASYQFLGILCVVKGDSGVCAHTFKLQEIPFAFLWLSDECFLVYSTAMQITMTQLAIAIVVIEVMRKVNAHN